MTITIASVVPPKRCTSWALVPWDGRAALAAHWYVNAAGDIDMGISDGYTTRGADETIVVIGVEAGGTTRARELGDHLGTFGLIEYDGPYPGIYELEPVDPAAKAAAQTEIDG